MESVGREAARCKLQSGGFFSQKLLAITEPLFSNKYMVSLLSLKGNPVNITGEENIVNPGFYMPNRLSVAVGKALHKLLDGKVCYLVDSTFPPHPEVMEYLTKKKVHIEYFDFRHTTSRAVREQILDQMQKGLSVVFLPGMVSKPRGCYADVPSPFLSTVGSLHISPVPVFVGYYTDTVKDLFRSEPMAGYREELSILPQLHPGPQTGERVMAAWLQRSSEIYAAQPILRGSLATALVKSMKANPKAEIIDGMTHSSLPNFKVLGVSMTVARILKERGDKRVGVILPPGPGGTIATLSCLLAGITPVIINYASSKSAFESTVRQAGLKTFITARKFMQKLDTFPWPPEEQLILVEDLLKGLNKKTLITNVLMAKAAPASVICKMYDTDARRNNDEAVMLFTSGSSGEPKGVVLSHRMILANVAQCANRIPLTEEKFLASLPIFHSFGLTVTMMLPLLTGYSFCAYPNPTDARSLCELCRRYELTVVCATPTFARAMLRRADGDTFKSVRYFIVGAEKLQPDLEREFKERCGVQLLEGYGLTEAAPVCAVNMPSAPMIPGSAFYVPGLVPRTIGTPLPGIAVRITDVDDDTRELPLTEQGMIWLKGANIFSGYVGKAEMNPTIFKDGWFKTGDIGRMDLNGFITLGGRLSRFSKIGGEMVPHEGVEQALTEIFSIDPAAEGGVQIAITGVTDPQKGEALVLLSALPEHQRNSEEKVILQGVRAAMNERQMPTLWAPKYIVPVEAIPVLPTGKLDLRSCKLLAEEALASVI